jgi:hypothetical protein
MSYISNGCNDCASVEFGGNGLLNGGNQTNYLNSNQGMFDNSSANQFAFQQPQQSQQQPQQPQQPMMQQQPQQQVQQPMIVQSTLSQPPMNHQPMQQQMQQPKMVMQKQVQVQVHAPVASDKNQGLQAIIGNYLMDNAFTLTIAFIVASAWHTTIKYYIDQAIKFSGGTPTYYIVYAVLATLVSIFLSSMK